MKPNLTIGEVVIHSSERSWLLRPSFQNTQALIDSGLDPIAILANLHSDLLSIGQPWRKSGFAIYDAVEVIRTYCQDVVPEELTGTMVVGKVRDKLLYKPGAMHWEDVLLIAHHVLRYALIGSPSAAQKRANTTEGPNIKFDPSQFVGMVISQLNATHSCAWDMTMVEFQRAWESKFPEQKSKGGAIKEDMSQEQLISLRDRAKAAQARHRESEKNKC